MPFTVFDDMDGLTNARTNNDSNHAHSAMRRLPLLEDPFLLPFSSGTSGAPKGVILSHANLQHTSFMFNAAEQYQPDDVFIGALPFYHIYGLLVYLACSLQLGITTVVTPNFHLETFLRLVHQYKATYLHLAPPMAIQLAKSALLAKYDLSSIRCVFSGAAPLGEDLEHQLSQALHGRAVIKQGYGLTETSPTLLVNPTQAARQGSVS